MLRTLVLAVHLLGVDRVMVVAHTDCRMATVTDARGARGDRGDRRHRHPQPGVPHDRRPGATLAADVQRIRSSPYLPAGLPVVGCVYDVRTGRIEVAVAE